VLQQLFAANNIEMAFDLRIFFREAIDFFLSKTTA
jgi:hypothetical protein